MDIVTLRKKEFAAKLEECETLLRKLLDRRKTDRDKETQNLSFLNSLIEKRKRLSAMKMPDAASEMLLLKKDTQNIRDKLADLTEELRIGDPYASVLELVEEEGKAAEQQSLSYKSEIKSLEDDIPYYDFWVKAFGDDGIRSFVIDEIVPSLNSRINYWLQFLMDGRIKLNFDNQLEETIERVPSDHDPFVYNSLSGGEHCRIDLAVSQAFAHVMMMTSGTCPSLVALDEVGANIDRPGIQSLYKMICELSRDRQVLVITHDPDLLDLLAGYDTIQVEMRNGITSLKNGSC